MASLIGLVSTLLTVCNFILSEKVVTVPLDQLIQSISLESWCHKRKKTFFVIEYHVLVFINNATKKHYYISHCYNTCLCIIILHMPCIKLNCFTSILPVPSKVVGSLKKLSANISATTVHYFQKAFSFEQSDSYIWYFKLLCLILTLPLPTKCPNFVL